MYIKLDGNMCLASTTDEVIYRGEDLSEKIIYLLPISIGKIDLADASVYLGHIGESGDSGAVALKRIDKKHNESYYQYTVPATCEMARRAGWVKSWLTIFTGQNFCPIVCKTGECFLHIDDPNNMDSHMQA